MIWSKATIIIVAEEPIHCRRPPKLHERGDHKVSIKKMAKTGQMVTIDEGHILFTDKTDKGIAMQGARIVPRQLGPRTYRRSGR